MRSKRKKPPYRPLKLANAEQIENRKKPNHYTSKIYYDYGKTQISSSIIANDFYLLSSHTHYDYYKTSAERAISYIDNQMPTTDLWQLDELIKQAEDSENQALSIIRLALDSNIGREDFLREVEQGFESPENPLSQFSKEDLERIIYGMIGVAANKELANQISNNKRGINRHQKLVNFIESLEINDLEKLIKDYSNFLKTIKSANIKEIEKLLSGNATLGKLIKMNKDKKTNSLVFGRAKGFAVKKSGVLFEPIALAGMVLSLKRLFQDSRITSYDISTALNSKEPGEALSDLFNRIMVSGQNPLTGKTAKGTADGLVLATFFKNIPDLRFYIDIKSSTSTSSGYGTNRKVVKSLKLQNIFDKVDYRDGRTGLNNIRDFLSKEGHDIIFKAIASAILINMNPKVKGNALYSHILEDYQGILRILALDGNNPMGSFMEEKEGENRMDLVLINKKLYYYSSILKSAKSVLNDEQAVTINLYGSVTRSLGKNAALTLYAKKLRSVRKAAKDKANFDSLSSNQEKADLIYQMILNQVWVQKYFEKIKQNSLSAKISIQIKNRLELK